MNKLKTNVFFHGDCLFVMKHDIPAESIDLIYLDPPFFTGQVQKGEWKPGDMQISYDDSKKFWSNKEIQENAPNWLKEFALRDPKSHWHPFARYLYYMYERLQECRNVLKSDGSIYLHCDWRASHYLKIILDEIFGHNNFQNEITWHYRRSSSISRFTHAHDIIFFYSKSNKKKFNPSEIKVYYKDLYGKNFKPALDDRRGGEDENGYYKYIYLDDVWNISGVFNLSKEFVGYPTQKPVKLLNRIIEASSNKGDVILDPFCGCGTALVAAHDLDRNWIGIDINEEAFEVIRDRGRQSKLDRIVEAPKLVRKSKGILEWVLSLNGKEFEDWVNNFYDADKPSPDKGVDGITKDGIAIQSKTWRNGVDYNLVEAFLGNAKRHRDSRIKKPLEIIMITSQNGFDDSARQRKYEIKSEENIEVKLITPEDMLKIK